MIGPQVDLASSAGVKQIQRPIPAADSGRLEGAADNPRLAFRTSRPMALPKLIEKSVIIHKDENGFGLRIKGQSPVYIEHVHENGAAWRAGVRAFDSICKVNGVPVSQMDHKDVVLMFKSCSRFVALTLISPEQLLANSGQHDPVEQANLISNLISCHHRQYSIYSHYASEEPVSAGPPLSKGAASPLDTTSLFANDGALDGQASLLAGGRTGRGSRMTPASRPQHYVGVALADYQLASRAPGSPLALNCLRNSPQQQQHKLNRRDSNDEDKSADGDKRIAICTCCQLQQCSRNSADLAHRHLIQRPPNRSPREPPPAVKHSCDTAKLDPPPQPAPLSGATAASTQSSDANRTVKGKPDTKRQNYTSERDQSQTSKGPAQSGVPAAVAPVAASRPKVINRRIEIIRELIDTERTHTERLRCLNELFYRPMKQAGFMTGEQLRMVFSCHRTLYRIHRQIYRILLSANFDIYPEPLVGSALLEIFEGDLKRRLERAACSFCSAQATNIELLNKLTRRDTKVGEFLAQVTSQRMIGRLGIKDLLASCFQRLTKYPLLLENLLKATPQMLPDEGDGRELAGVLSLSSGPAVSGELCGRAGQIGAAEDGCSEPGGHENRLKNGPGLEAEGRAEDETESGRLRGGAAEEARRNSRRMLAISLAEEREFIERALVQSRQILVQVNDSIRVSMSRNKLKEIWKRTDKHPGVPLIDITKQQVVHEGLLTLRLSKRSFDVYVLLLNDYIIILTREGQDKYRLKFFTPEGKSTGPAGGGAASGGPGAVGPGAPFQAAAGQASGQLAAGTSNLTPHQTVYSPVFVIDEHLTTRDAATDENGFYLLCKRKDDSRIYEFASRSPAERMKWRDKIQWTIERQMSRNSRRPSCASTLTKSSSEISANGLTAPDGTTISASAANRRARNQPDSNDDLNGREKQTAATNQACKQDDESLTPAHLSRSSSRSGEPTKIVGTISYVMDDGIVMPNKMESSRVLVDQAIQVNILDGGKVSAARGHEGRTNERPT